MQLKKDMAFFNSKRYEQQAIEIVDHQIRSPMDAD